MDVHSIDILEGNSDEEGGKKQWVAQHIFVEYIKVLTNAIQVNYEKTDSLPRSIVCSDVISNIFIVMLKKGTSLDTISSTCKKAATLYTESLHLLQYCLSSIKLQQITDIKRFVYLKTIGSYDVANEEQDVYEDDVALMAKTIFLMKDIIQQLIQCTVVGAGVDDDAVVSRSKLLTLFICVYEVLQNNGQSFASEQIECLISHICEIQSSHPCTTEEISALLIRYSIHSMLYNYIYETIQDVDISVANFNTLNLQDRSLIPLEHADNKHVTNANDVRDHGLFKESVAFLCAHEVDGLFQKQ